VPFHRDASASLLARYPRGDTGQPAGVAPFIDRETRVGCSVDSSCELLIHPAWESAHSCVEPCRTLSSIRGGDGYAPRF
jgi:hypothetical protein